jgi:hypothetical protein
MTSNEIFVFQGTISEPDFLNMVHDTFPDVKLAVEVVDDHGHIITKVFQPVTKSRAGLTREHCATWRHGTSTGAIFRHSVETMNKEKALAK